MANTIPPATNFALLDPEHATNHERRFRRAALNAAAVVCAEHFRAMGWRGHHMIALNLLAISRWPEHPGIASGAEADSARMIDVATGLAVIERARWADLQMDSGWQLAEALIAGSVEGRENLPSAVTKQAEDMLELLEDYDALAKMFEVAMKKGHPLPGATRWICENFEKGRQNLYSRAFFPAVGRLLTRAEGGTLSLEKAWMESRELFCAPELPPIIPPPSSPEERKARRLAAGSAAWDALLEPCRWYLPSMEKALRDRVRLDAPSHQAADLAGLLKILNGDYSGLRFSTFLSSEAYDRFCRAGRYADAWETGPTWHHRYSDQPLAARLFHEHRLYGERGDGICHGYLATNEAWAEECGKKGGRLYGEVEIRWRPESVRKWATFIFGDQHDAKFLMDAADDKHLIHAALACMHASDWGAHEALQPLHKFMPPSRLLVPPAPYLEFQCHRELTPGDVAEIILHGPRA